MALHGELRINTVLIGRWQARRLEPLENVDAHHTYDCTVEWLVPSGRHDFELQHKYSDGAAVLASKVLYWGQKAQGKS